LAEAGYQVEVVVPSEEAETATPGPVKEEEPSPPTPLPVGEGSVESPEQLVTRLARQKAADVAARVDRGLVVGCDTVVECDGKILGKPANTRDARRMLQALSGREHRVLSGLCLWPVPSGKYRVGVAATRLRMDRLDEAEIDVYLASGLWQGKAGAFGYQDRLGWIHVVEGSESNVVGLPVELLAEMLSDARRRYEG